MNLILSARWARRSSHSGKAPGKAYAGFVYAVIAERRCHCAQEQAVNQTAAPAVGLHHRLARQEYPAKQHAAGKQDILFQVDALAHIFPWGTQGWKFVQVGQQPGHQYAYRKVRHKGRKLHVAAHQQVQPTGHNDQNSAAAQRPSHITGQQVDGTVRRQATGRQGGVAALGQHHSGAAEKCQHCTRCRVGRHDSRPC